MYSTVFMILAVFPPEPSAFVLRVEGNTEATIMCGETQLHRNRIYRIQPFYGRMRVHLTLHWVDGEVRRDQEFVMEVESGMYHTFTLTVPGFPNIRLCGVGNEKCYY
jgi:hypothetical protein